MSKPFRLTSSVPLESAVQHMVRRALEWSPAVAWVGRFNSGSAMLPAKGGRLRPVKFHDVEGLSDLMGQMIDGRFLAIEVKRPGWKGPTDDRERKQESFIETVRRCGGVAGFVTSPEEAIELLKGAQTNGNA